MIWLKVFPEHKVVVPIELEELFIIVNVVLQWEYFLEIAFPI